MSLDLKHIPCPAGNKCTAFKCLFGHESEKPKEEPVVSSAQSSNLNQAQAGATSAAQAELRKRVNVQQGHHQSSPKAASSSATPPKKRPIEEIAGSPLSARRPVSPPPLKRATQKPSLSSGGTSSAPARPKRSLDETESSSGSNSPAKKRKPETLNPRLLKSSPASHETRIRLLRLLHNEYSRLNQELKKDANDDEKRLIVSDQDLIFRVLDEEQKTAVEKPAVYANIMKNKVMQYKRMGVAQWKTEREKDRATELKKTNSGGASDAPKVIETGLTPAQEVEILHRLLTPITELANHGYVPAVPSDEAIRTAREGREAAKGWEKCDRCQQRFQVFPGRRAEDGALTSGGSCTFHWGKPYLPAKSPGDRTRVPKRFRCCNEDVGESAGCLKKDHHVYKTSDAKTLASVLNYAETPANPNAPKDRAVGFDCEMGYTVHGLELIRLTAVSWPDGGELLDVLVRPVGEILDLNSRFSGVWPEDMAQAQPWSASDGLPPLAKSSGESGSEDGELRSNKKELKLVSSPEVARDLLFTLLSPTTPLIGHGIENDLNAVRVVHPTVVDTVLLFPHKAGLPYRYGLKMLMDHHLNRKIQQETGSKVVGHDSAEDARAAGELARLKVMNEWNALKTKGWKSISGKLVPGPEEST